LQRAAARRQAVPVAPAGSARGLAAAHPGAALPARRRALLRALPLERVAEGGGLEPAADLPAALVPRRGLPRLRAARAPLHRVRDAPLPRPLLRARRRRVLRRAGRGDGPLPARSLAGAGRGARTAHGGGRARGALRGG